MPLRQRAKVLSFLLGTLLSILGTAVAMASDGQVPFPK